MGARCVYGSYHMSTVSGEEPIVSNSEDHAEALALETRFRELHKRLFAVGSDVSFEEQQELKVAAIEAKNVAGALAERAPVELAAGRNLVLAALNMAAIGRLDPEFTGLLVALSAVVAIGSLSYLAAGVRHRIQGRRLQRAADRFWQML